MLVLRRRSLKRGMVVRIWEPFRTVLLYSCLHSVTAGATPGENLDALRDLAKVHIIVHPTKAWI